MVTEGPRVIHADPNQAIFPVLAITMCAFNFPGDGLHGTRERTILQI